MRCNCDRGRRRKPWLPQFRISLQEETMATTLEAELRPDIRIDDVEYQRQGGRALLARLYRPAGTGPYPAVLQVHGGAWVNKDRTDNDFIAKALAAGGMLVASIDFRMPPGRPTRPRSPTSTWRRAGSKRAPGSTAAARTGSVAWAPRAAATRCCLRQC